MPEAFAEHGNAAYCKLVGAALARVPDPVVLTQRPRDLKTTVARTDHSTVVHLLSFVPARQTPNLCLVHHPVPVVDMPLAVRLDAPPPPVDLEPGSVELDATYDDNYVRTRATVLDGHTMVVFEDTAPTA